MAAQFFKKGIAGRQRMPPSRTEESRVASTGGKTKLEKLLGNPNFEDDCRDIANGDLAFMSPTQCARFWSLLTKNSNKSGCLASVIIIHFCKYYKDPKKSAKKHAMAGDLPKFTRHMHSLINTLILLDLYGALSLSNKDMRVALSAFKEFDAANRDHLIEEELYLRFRQCILDFSQTRSPTWVIIDVTQFEGDEMAGMMGLSAAASKLTDPQEMLRKTYSRFQYMLLKLKVLMAREPARVFSELTKLLSSLTKLRTHVAMSSRQQVQALLQLMRHFVTLCPTSDMYWLHSVTRLVAGLCKWPLPFSVVARKLQEMLEGEMHAPGMAMRRTLHEEMPGLDPRGLKPGEEVTAAKFCQTYFMLVEGSNDLAMTFAEVLDACQGVDVTRAINEFSSADGQEPAVEGGIASLLSSEFANLEDESDRDLAAKASVHLMRQQCLLHIFSCDFEITPPSDSPVGTLAAAELVSERSIAIGDEGSMPIEDDLLQLSSKSEAEVARWYARALDILDHAQTLPTDQPMGLPGGRCKEYREARLRVLLREISPDVEFVPARCDPNQMVADRPTLALEPSRSTLPVTRSAALSIEPVVEDEVSSTQDQAKTLPPPPPPPTGNGPAEQLGVENPWTPTLPGAWLDLRTLVNAAAEKDATGYVMYRGEADEALMDLIFDKADAVLASMPAEAEAVGEFKQGEGGEEPDEGAAGQGPSCPPAERSFVPFMGQCMRIKHSDSWLPCSSELVDLNADLWSSVTRSKRTLKVAVMGGNKACHRLVCALQQVHAARPEIFSELLDLRVYLVPTRTNDLGNYLAWADRMYQRQVYSAFVDVPAYAPMYSTDTPHHASLPTDAPRLGQTLPSLLQKDALEDYLRFARELYPASVWNCVCWAHSTKERSVSSAAAEGADEQIRSNMNAINAAPDAVIPFMVSAEIGIHAQAEVFRHQHSARDASLEMLLSDRKKYSLFQRMCAEQPAVRVTYRPFVERTAEPVEGAAPPQNLNQQMEGCYTSLSVRNLPEYCTTSPYSKTLDTEMRGGNAPSLQSTSLYYREHTGRLLETIRAPAHCKHFADCYREAACTIDHVGTVEISSVADEGFQVLLDGTLHGPYQRLRILPSELVVPLANYFPISKATFEG